MTEDKSVVKSDQCLRLFSLRRQPPLLVVTMRNNEVTIKSIVVQLKKLNEVYPIVSESRSLFGTTHGPGFVTIMTIKRP